MRQEGREGMKEGRGGSDNMKGGHKINGKLLGGDRKFKKGQRREQVRGMDFFCGNCILGPHFLKIVEKNEIN